jgi:hypothetical protein
MIDLIDMLLLTGLIELIEMLRRGGGGGFGGVDFGVATRAHKKVNMRLKSNTNVTKKN